ncbi:PRC and DUF2382 domain-containing protein [Leptolyngbya sp. AN02str]|uniref:PRC and DUF2382 domain-containing protein n=1 Tax=Leptolyngbya sp. AN02str TaxID=3423363 RepID=UPI003D31EDDC
MALHKIKDFYPDYPELFGNHDILGYSVYATPDDKVGSADNLMVDEDGRFRYLVVNTGVWIFGKKVLLPVGRARIDYDDRRIYVDGLTRDQVENLPEFDNDMTVDYDYEERVRNVYRPGAATGVGTDRSMTADKKGVTRDRTASTSQTDTYDRNSYRYDEEPGLYGINEGSHGSLRLYEERLVADKTRRKAGEVALGKHVETKQANVSVPVEKERVVIERSGGAANQAVTPGADAFQEGEVARVEVYEETPEIHKEAFVREDVSVRKVVDRDTVEANETLRREELDLDTQGNPVVRDSKNPGVDKRRTERR